MKYDDCYRCNAVDGRLIDFTIFDPFYACEECYLHFKAHTQVKTIGERAGDAIASVIIEQENRNTKERKKKQET